MTAPKDYFPKYSHADIKRRVLYLSERCFNFINCLKLRHPSWDIAFDPLIMTNVGVSAMDDIWRWKVYHLRDIEHPKRSDAIKRTAYFTKWLVKLRPIYFVRPLDAHTFISSFDKNDSTLLINEAFAFHVARGSLATEAGVAKILTTPELTANILYDLHYRKLSEDALMQIYELIRTAARKQPLLIP